MSLRLQPPFARSTAGDHRANTTGTISAAPVVDFGHPASHRQRDQNLDSHAVNWGSFNGGIDVANAGNSLTVSQAISGSGSLTKAGPGLLVLSGSNSYTGDTIITAGTLSLAIPRRYRTARST